jgi:hypothetical protein
MTTGPLNLARYEPDTRPTDISTFEQSTHIPTQLSVG